MMGPLAGTIRVLSSPGEGSTFSLWIPRQLDGASPQTTEKADRHLLVIDDEDTFRYIVRQMVGDVKGLEVTEAKSGVEGLSMARHMRPDAIILDVLMPGMTGHEVLRTIKRDPDLESIPVLIITSMPITPRLREELVGAAGIMAKQDLSKEGLRAFLGSTKNSGLRA